MKKSLPYKVAVGKLCKTGATVTGIAGLDKFSRLRELLIDADGEITAELEFYIDEQKHQCVAGQITGQLKLLCQRCLEAMDYPLALEVQWVLQHDGESVAEIPSGYEAVDCQDDTLALVDSIEDDLILALPLIAKHDLAQCPAQKWIGTNSGKVETAEEKTRPFSQLKELQPK